MRYVLFILTFLSFVTLQGQIDTIDPKDVIPCRRAANGVLVVKNKVVSYNVYNAATRHNDSLRKLRDSSTYDKPVWVRVRYKNGALSSEGLYCGECRLPIGPYISYYENGNIKMKLTYAAITDKQGLKKRKKASGFFWCSEEDGQKMYYDETGQLKHIEFLEKGKLIRCENYKEGKLVGTNCG
jgi:hypothetical protein